MLLLALKRETESPLGATPTRPQTSTEVWVEMSAIERAPIIRSPVALNAAPSPTLTLATLVSASTLELPLAAETAPPEAILTRSWAVTSFHASIL
ncbi:hypothetical protein D9M68_921960 [compost metagenome]